MFSSCGFNFIVKVTFPHSSEVINSQLALYKCNLIKASYNYAKNIVSSVVYLYFYTKTLSNLQRCIQLRDRVLKLDRKYVKILYSKTCMFCSYMLSLCLYLLVLLDKQ